MEIRHAIQRAIRQNYAILLQEYKFTYCAVCIWFSSVQDCEKGLLPVTSIGEPCPYYCFKHNEALQSKSTGIEQLA